MSTITCSLCRKVVETGQEHCPHCHLRLPGVLPVKKAPVPAADPVRPRRRAAAAPRSQPRQPAATQQCPACAHAVTRDDRWCRWCKWPVNRERG